MSDEDRNMLDVFAGAALVGLLAGTDYLPSPDGTAENAFRYAAAMLRERSRRRAAAATDIAPDPDGEVD